MHSHAALGKAESPMLLELIRPDYVLPAAELHSIGQWLCLNQRFHGGLQFVNPFHHLNTHLLSHYSSCCLKKP
jgi:hypothetical protein